MPLPVRFVFVGDLHTGGVTAIAPKRKVDSAGQSWLAERWSEFTKSVLEVKGPYVLMLGGDLIEGHHHGSLSFWGTKKEQRDGAIELLQPLANKAHRIYGVKGTEAHGGPNGEDDQQVEQELGSRKIDWHIALDLENYNGHHLSWCHHGMTAPQDADNEDNGMLTAIKRYDALYKKRILNWLAGGQKGKQPKRYTFLVSHHTHRSPEIVRRRGVSAALVGCWQLPTAYGQKIGPRSSVDIGALIWEPEIDRIRPVLYAQEETVTKF